ncbi:hypothetical protein KHS38_11745 [Mucilaginibacter sp. Bleaf8]|uniref:hypothetical protein n=1 Tax=Mucilaginibacter sp. Bleaf8 TaxID=2834430 RepID=UPI001BCE2B42|nr:hypothetical protein [Mucilaginibacter sp. Bleaf8]MBS7565078.1 hypothetical protein [Mucilaginibacter sp. Bleaf8]
MKKFCIAALLLVAASGSGTTRKHKESTQDAIFRNSVAELASAADRLNRSADSLGKAITHKTR